HNALLHDARVEREAAALAAAGYEVRVVAARGAGTPAHERRDGFDVERVDSDPAPTRAVRRALASRGRDAEIGTVAAPLHAARPLWRALERRLAPQADAVLTVGDGVARELALRYGIPSPAVVRNVPAAAAAGTGERSPLRGALDLPDDVRIALYLGGLQPGRG